VSYRLVPTNIVALGWFLQSLLSLCSYEEICVSCRLVSTNIVIVGWCLYDIIKIYFVVFSHFGFPR
jgi:hypothetical protein